MDVLAFHRQMDLRAPHLVVAFAGWPDQAGVASRGSAYLCEQLAAEPVGEIRSDSFFDFTVARPVALIREGVIQHLRFPAFELRAWRDPQPAATHDLLILLGTEPNLHWQRFMDALLALVEPCQVPDVLTLGRL